MQTHNAFFFVIIVEVLTRGEMRLSGDIGDDGRRLTLTSIRNDLRLYHPEISTSTPNLTGDERYRELSKRLTLARESLTSKPHELKRQPVSLNEPDTKSYEVSVSSEQGLDVKDDIQQNSNLEGQNIADHELGGFRVEKAESIAVLGNMYTKNEATMKSRQQHNEYRSKVLKSDREKRTRQDSAHRARLQENSLLAAVMQQFNLSNDPIANKLASIQNDSKESLSRNQARAPIKYDTEDNNNDNVAAAILARTGLNFEKVAVYSQPTLGKLSGLYTGSPKERTLYSMSEDPLFLVGGERTSTDEIQEFSGAKDVSKQERHNEMGKRAIVFLKGNLLAEARDSFERALLEDPVNLVTLCNFSIFCMQHLKNPEMAKALFLRFIASLSTDTLVLNKEVKVNGLLKFAHFFRANALLNEAKAAFRVSLDLDPKNSLVADRYANFLMSTNEGMSGESVLTVCERNAKLLCAYGNLLSAKGNHTQAQAIYLQCNETDRSTFWYRNYSILLRNARS